MALIACPECGKEVSDKAKMCPNCGYPINDPMNNKELKANINSHVMIFEGKSYDMSELVNYMEIPNDNPTWKIEHNMLARIIPPLRISGYNELLGYIETYHTVPEEFIPTGDPYKYRLVKPKDYNPNNPYNYYYEKDKPDFLKPPVPKCPKCGCTNIQVVPKKWSFFTGFLTNKTERVCANCKYKW